MAACRVYTHAVTCRRGFGNRGGYSIMGGGILATTVEVRFM